MRPCLPTPCSGVSSPHPLCTGLRQGLEVLTRPPQPFDSSSQGPPRPHSLLMEEAATARVPLPPWHQQPECTHA